MSNFASASGGLLDPVGYFRSSYAPHLAPSEKCLDPLPWTPLHSNRPSWGQCPWIFWLDRHWGWDVKPYSLTWVQVSAKFATTHYHHRRTQDFTMEGVHVVGAAWARGSGERKSLSGVQGQRPGRGSGGRDLPDAEMLKQNVKLAYNL